MAEFDRYAPLLLRAECTWRAGFPYPESISKIETLFELARPGAYVNNPNDKGGPTYAGITLQTYRQFYGSRMTVNNLCNMAYHEWRTCYKSGYWDVMQGDKWDNQSVADICADWLVNSGTKRIRDIQRIVGVTADGVVGPKTLAAINGSCPMCLHAKIKTARQAFYDNIISHDPTQAVFRKGWTARLGYFNFSLCS